MNSHLDRIRDWPSLAHAARYRPGKLAQLCEVSTRRLESYFAEKFHAAPRVWLDSQRLKTAANLLRSGKLVKEVAFDLGFNDCSHFCKTFKRRFSVSPLAYLAIETPENRDVSPPANEFRD